MTETDTKVPVALGFRAGRGGSVVVGVAADHHGPRVVLSTFLATAAEGDRLSYEPYHVAAEMARGPNCEVTPEAKAAVAEGRRRQAGLAAKALDELVRRLGDMECRPVVAALLINRAGWITDLLEHSLSAPEHPPVAEGLAVRDALRSACAQCAIDVVEMDEKSLPDAAAVRLGLFPGDVDAGMNSLGASAGKPWRKEQKAACLAAWAAVTEAQRRALSPGPTGSSAPP
jgi:hypothetical protein